MGSVYSHYGNHYLGVHDVQPEECHVDSTRCMVGDRPDRLFHIQPSSQQSSARSSGSRVATGGRQLHELGSRNPAKISGSWSSSPLHTLLKNAVDLGKGTD